MKITYYGHACFSVEVAGKTLLFDPFISPNPLARAGNVDINSISADYILLSHGHEDHVADTEAIGKRTQALVIANFELVNWLGRKGLTKFQPVNHGGVARFDFGTVKYVNAIHSSSMPDGSYGGNPGGFVVETNEGNFYYSGDTALTEDMKLIGESVQLRFAALCIGGNYTMGVEDAVKAADFIRCNEIFGVHYDTFPPIKIDRKAAMTQFREAGKTLRLLKVAESHVY
jgi:L-ascorbate metabolism protein UlaG (beta-lactamase superfamily)